MPVKKLAIWNVTHRCSHRCSYCGMRDYYRGQPELDPTTIEQIAQQIVEAGFQEVIFAGGEPLSFASLPHAIRVLSGHCSVASFTGGVPGDPQPAVDLVASGIDRVVFSLDGPTEAANDVLRGRDGATRDLLALARLVREARPANTLAFNTVVSRHNVEALDGVLAQIAPLRFPHWSVTMVATNLEKQPHESYLSPEQIRTFFERIVPTLDKTCRASGITLRLLPTPWPFRQAGVAPPNYGEAATDLRALLDEEYAKMARGLYNETFVTEHGCPLIGLDISIGPRGEVFPCSQPATYQARYAIGSLLEQPLSEILEGEALARFRDGMPHPVCSACHAPSNLPDSAHNRRLRPARRSRHSELNT